VQRRRFLWASQSWTGVLPIPYRGRHRLVTSTQSRLGHRVQRVMHDRFHNIVPSTTGRPRPPDRPRSVPPANGCHDGRLRCGRAPTSDLGVRNTSVAHNNAWPGAPPERRGVRTSKPLSSTAAAPSSPKPQAAANRSLFKRHIAGVPHRRYSCEMRPLRYSINVTLDGCCDHRAMPGRRLASYAVENLHQRCSSLWPGDLRNDGIAWRPPAPTERD